jgi:hypothetical protein
MPIGPYKDWAECIADQKSKGHGDESARKICGKIEANTRNETMAIDARIIREKRRQVAKQAQEDELRFISTRIASYELRKLELKYEMENGNKLPYEEDEQYRWLFEEDYLERNAFAELSSAARNKLPDSSFALPGRRYPIHDRAHAANALARVSQHGTPEEKAKVRAAVCKKYPDLGQCKGKDENEKTSDNKDVLNGTLDPDTNNNVDDDDTNPEKKKAKKKKDGDK